MGAQRGLPTIRCLEKEGIKGLRMAVNLSANQLRSVNLVASVQQLVERYALHEGELET